MDVFTPAQLNAVQPSNVLKIRNFECGKKKQHFDAVTRSLLTVLDHLTRSGDQ